MPLNYQTASKIVNLMSANDYTGTARTWAQAKTIVEAMDLLPTNAELAALNGDAAPATWATISGHTLSQKSADQKTYFWYDINSWPHLTGL